jgi:hypothetical protein
MFPSIKVRAPGRRKGGPGITSNDVAWIPGV